MGGFIKLFRTIALAICVIANATAAIAATDTPTSPVSSVSIASSADVMATRLQKAFIDQLSIKDRPAQEAFGRDAFWKARESAKFGAKSAKSRFLVEKQIFCNRRAYCYCYYKT